jgi:hypothetical protein
MAGQHSTTVGPVVTRETAQEWENDQAKSITPDPKTKK